MRKAIVRFVGSNWDAKELERKEDTGWVKNSGDGGGGRGQDESARQSGLR